MAVAAKAKSLNLSDLGPITLRIGDSDSHHRWGGHVQHGYSGTPVTQLQTALVAVGLLKKVDGGFGPGTQAAVKRFQWYGKNMDYRLKLAGPGAAPASGSIVTFSMSVACASGTCDKALAAEILAWVAGNFVTTTPLVRLSLDDYDYVDTSDTFKILSYPSAQAGEILVHADFTDAIGTLNDEAGKAKVNLKINQSFRNADVPPSGAVVAPASKSQHLVGHAVDLNIVDGDTTNTAAMFKSGDETDAADTFVDGVKAQHLRWGGDFGNSDPIHFDDFLNPSGEDYEMNYYFAQHCFHAQHPMRQVP